MRLRPFPPRAQVTSKSVLPPYSQPCPLMETSCILQNKIQQVQEISQAPLPLAMLAGLATSAFLTQGLASVRKPNGQTVPVSLFCISIAESGERKSTVLNEFTKPIDSFLANRKAQEQSAWEPYELKLEIWTATRKRLIRAISKAESEGTDEKNSHRISHNLSSHSLLIKLHKHLKQHDQRKPTSPKSPGITIMSDATPAAIAHHLSQCQIKSLGILSSEGDEFFSRGIKQNPALFDNAWSGDPTRRHRVVEGDQSIQPDISIGASLQPAAAEAIFIDRKKKLRSSGFAARALFAFPPSNQGFRTVIQHVNDDPRDEVYQQRVHQLLKLNEYALEENSSSKKVIGFTPDAQEEWFRLQWEIEIEMRPNGRYFNFRDHASKLADNVARVAGVLSAINHGLESDISLEILRQSINICVYCSDEFLRIFHEPPQEEVDTVNLDEWFEKKYQAGYRYIPKSFTLTHGPLRPAARLNIALGILYDQKKIGILNYPRQTATGRPTKPKVIIDLCPNDQPNHIAMQQTAYAY